MKNILSAMGVRKMDEMERDIANSAIRYAYLFLIVALLIWSITESVLTMRTHGAHRATLVPCMLLVGASLIQSFSQLILRARRTAGDEEYRETWPIGKALVIALAVAVVITVGGSMLTFFLVGMR